MASANEIKPHLIFNETQDDAEFNLVIEGLKVGRRFQNPIKKRPKNGRVIEADFGKQTLNYAIEVKPKGAPESARRLYRFSIKRLPTEINPEKTKIKYDTNKVTITLHKQAKEPWSPFADNDYETIHNVKN